MSSRARATCLLGAVLAALVLATTVVPVFAQTGGTYQLSALVQGSGKVVSDPPGIDCGSDCDHRYAARTAVALSAIPQSGYELESWGGDCSGAGACSVTMSADRRVTASFRPAPPPPPPPPPPNFRRLDVSVAGGGRITSQPGGIDCGNDCSEAFPVGARVTLQGAAKGGFRFGRWRGACTGASATCTLTIGAATAGARSAAVEFGDVQAGFVPKPAPRRPLRRRGLIVGTNKSDVLKVKGRGAVVVYGLGGNDKLIGGKRNDILIGGTGRDRIQGGKGRDLLIGDSGTDRLNGGPAGDTLVGGLGRDRLKGGPGNDTLNPGASAEAVNGGSGTDVLVSTKRSPLKTLVKKGLEKLIPLGPPIAYSHGPGAGGFEKVWALEIGPPGKLPAENETITEDARGERHPSWSPTGLRLTYQGVEPAALDFDLFVINQDGSGKKNLTQGNGADDVEPAWSPDGKRIAFVRNAVLHTMKTNGTDVKQLTPSPYDADPSWAPDGQKIYFARTVELGDFELFSINPDGSGLTQITANEVHDDHPALSPDGKTLAWDAGVAGFEKLGEADQPPDILVKPLSFPFPLNLASHPQGDAEPAWSPNGKKIVFHSLRDGNDLWVVNLGGSSLIDVTSPGVVVPGTNKDPAWRW